MKIRCVRIPSIETTLQVGFYRIVFSFPSLLCSSQRLPWSLYCGTIGAGLGEKPPGLPPPPTGRLLRPAPRHASPQRRSNAASSARHPYQMNSAQLSSRAGRVRGGGGRWEEERLFIQHYSRPRDPSRLAFSPPHTDLQVELFCSPSSFFCYFSLLHLALLVFLIYCLVAASPSCPAARRLC